MMTGNNVATLSDKNKRNDIEVEINKGGEQKEYVEIRVKDDRGEWIKSYISIKELYGLIFMLVGEEEQKDMMPVQKTEVRVYERQHRIKLNKNMKKGDIVVANCRIEVPLIVEEGLSGLVRKRAKRLGILVPE
jgi:hypothetical protein